jgi:hypothetical protein
VVALIADVAESRENRGRSWRECGWVEAGSLARSVTPPEFSSGVIYGAIKKNAAYPHDTKKFSNAYMP